MRTATRAQAATAAAHAPRVATLPCADVGHLAGAEIGKRALAAAAAAIRAAAAGEDEDEDDADAELALFVSVDLDVLDPCFCPAVAHLEPGGLSTRQLVELPRESLSGRQRVDLPCRH